MYDNTSRHTVSFVISYSIFCNILGYPFLIWQAQLSSWFEALHGYAEWNRSLLRLSMLLWCYNVMYQWDVSVWCISVMYQWDVSVWCISEMYQCDISVWVYRLIHKWCPEIRPTITQRYCQFGYIPITSIVKCYNK